MKKSDSGHDFGKTHWSLIGDLRSEDPEKRRAAMTALVTMYRGPVYAYLRRLGCDREEAAELTQAFFEKKVLGNGLFARADRKRARLRSLIRTALRNFRTDEHRRRKARGGAITVAPFDVEHEERVLATRPALSPLDAFQKRWASVILEEALRRCQRHYRETGREKQWEAFFARTVRPILYGSALRPQSEIAEEVGMRDAPEVASAVHEVRRRLLVLLQEVVAETVDDPAEADDELRDILRTLE